ncbi:unnamed protein product [Heligmosomoides polygyrus]|uniref:Uncharacterized protein n=1 Tax=Heligmosomoides polygyrus TaxID=6339 RepID=A0A183GR86_HELPZ|nr:unnamed protein product [Heligmosomoides polygyrus]
MYCRKRKLEFNDSSPCTRYETPKIIRRPLSQLNSPAIVEDDFNIEREEEHPTGNTARRDLTLEERPLPQTPARPSCLHDCIKSGVIDMMFAGEFIHTLRTQRKLSEGSYEEFVRFAASEVRKFTFVRFKYLSSCEEYRDLHTEATQLMADILMAKSTIFDKRLTTTAPEPNTPTASTSTFSVANCSKQWILDADLPFMNVDLINAALSWTPRARESTFVQSLSLFRHILKQITHPWQKIKEYAVRLNGKNGRDGTLKNLPDAVEGTLLGFAEDMLGYGKDELKFGATFDRTQSRYYMSLGNNDVERESALEDLIMERSVWRKQLLKALQRAMY